MSTPQLSTKSNGSTGSSLVAASAQGVKFLLILQVSSRLLTFAVNQLLLRYLSPVLLGISAQLEFLAISIIYFSRESLRGALLRQTYSTRPTGTNNNADNNDTQTVVNLSWLTLPIGMIFASLLGLCYMRSTEASQQPYFQLSIMLYMVATLVELAAEPWFAVAQQKMDYKIRACAESSAAFVRCLVICGLTIKAARSGLELGPLGFAIGQVTYGVILLSIYSLSTWGVSNLENFTMWPRWIVLKKKENIYFWDLFHISLSKLAMTMWIQSSIKHLLTQGDTLLIAYLTTIEEQGTYALAANYGSIVARMLFQPLEESARNLFSKILSPSSSVSNDRTKTAARILRIILKLYVLLSFFALSLGPPFAPLGLSLIAGARWGNSAASNVLATYCYYIPLLAINGITEAFVQSVATPAQLHKQSAWMFGFSLGFGIASYYFVCMLELGAQGLVWANVVNMALRIVWSSVFIRHYFNARKIVFEIREIIPSGLLISVFMGIGAIARKNVDQGKGVAVELGYTTGLGLCMVSLCAIIERPFFQEIWNIIRAGG